MILLDNIKATGIQGRKDKIRKLERKLEFKKIEVKNLEAKIAKLQKSIEARQN